MTGAKSMIEHDETEFTNRAMGEEWRGKREDAERRLATAIDQFLESNSARAEEEATNFLRSWHIYRDALAAVVRKLNEGGTNAPLAATVAWVEETTRLERVLAILSREQ